MTAGIRYIDSARIPYKTSLITVLLMLHVVAIGTDCVGNTAFQLLYCCLRVCFGLHVPASEPLPSDGRVYRAASAAFTVLALTKNSTIYIYIYIYIYC
jgi:hypothetical protein